MKNIHLIRTDNPSRLVWQKNMNKLILYSRPMDFQKNDLLPHRIYITDNSEIKDGDITIYGKSLFLVESILHKSGPFRHLNPKIKIQGRFLPDMTIGKFDSLTPLKKIILTTDDQLIQNGVQAIDDEFLEWFVKNPSCEEVEVIKNYLSNNGQWKDVLLPSEWEIDTKIKYKIIIPHKEPKQTDENGKPITYWGGLVEPKQETLEDAAERYSLELLASKAIQPHEKTFIKSIFIQTAKSDAAKDYWYSQFQQGKWVQVEKIKAQIEMLEGVDGVYYYAIPISRKIESLQKQLKQLEDGN